MNRCAVGLAYALAIVALGACGGDDVTPGDAGPPDAGPPPRCAPLPTGDTRWAQYPMPGTPRHPRSYEVTGTPDSEAVIDCATGLEWQRAVDPGIYTQADAGAYCDGLTLAGYTDWRLPSRVELVTLVNYAVAEPGPTIDATAFPGTPGDVFWSASAAGGRSSAGWGVGFDRGYAFSGFNAANTYRVRCVRGDDAVGIAMGAPTGHFTDLRDATVRDNLTGLVWQQGFSPSIQVQAESVTYCSRLTVSRGGGWRLPTVAELQTLVDEAAWRPSIDPAYFPSTPEEAFWSSSSAGGSPSKGWVVHFFFGDAFDTETTGNTRARCVR